jgi:hypothetical protein
VLRDVISVVAELMVSMCGGVGVGAPSVLRDVISVVAELMVSMCGGVGVGAFSVAWRDPRGGRVYG